MRALRSEGVLRVLGLRKMTYTRRVADSVLGEN